MYTTPDTYWDLFAGYSVLWAFVAFFLFRLVSKQRKLSKLLEESKQTREG